MIESLPFTLPALREAYRSGLSPAAVVAEAQRRISDAGDPAIFIHRIDPDRALAEAAALGPFDPEKPLWGVPFAIKDNIDLGGVPTTAACPAFAFTPAVDAPVVARLRAAGAIPLGKTNLDQFATGLVGTRSPFGVPRNALDPAIVPGGSSSGSAVAVARGLVTFALGTDTAGSGRVPAALNNIVGLKPSLGALSTRGVVPACRTLDVVSVFALTVDDAWEAYRAAAGFDPGDPYSRHVGVRALGGAPPHPRIGIPDPATRRFFGDALQARAFEDACVRMEKLGASLVELDFTPFHDTAAMLYEGAWVAERLTVIEALLARDPEAVHPVIRRIVEPARDLSAADAFRGFYRLAELRRAVAPVLAGVDLLAVPSIPSFCTLADLAADPISPNARLGTYTNFVNLLGLCGLTVPQPARPDGRPGSVTLLAQDGRDALIAAFGRVLERDGPRGLGATAWPLPPATVATPGAAPDEIEIVVCGAHMSGLPLNGELTGRGARFLRVAETTDAYRLFALPGGMPARPGLLRGAPGSGGPIRVEVWALPAAEFGGFLAGIPAPLSIGTVLLGDGTAPKGFLCEAAATLGARDVTVFGDWRRVIGEAAA
jgi:allophanate hydrolase